MLALITAPEIAPLALAHRLMVEVASNTDDDEGIPLDVRTVDLLVSAPTREALALAIADAQWLNSYSLMNYWIPEDGEPEF